MAANDPHNDNRIEDLLSQLSGIFGKLSKSEEEEAKGKVDPKEAKAEPPTPASPPPTAPPAEEKPAPLAADPFSLEPPVTPTGPPLPTEAPPITTESSAPVEPPPVTTPEPVVEPPPMPEPMPEVTPMTEAPPMFDPVAAPIPEPAPPPEPVAVPVAEAAPAPAAAAADTGVPTAVFFPAGRDKEARILAEKLESLTPKFTKVAFRLRVSLFEAYDPKGDWRENIVAKAANGGMRTVFVVADRPLDDARRKAVAAEFESRKLYFQDVPLISIEKKAFYTDLLLGLVFFFDSQRGPTE